MKYFFILLAALILIGCESKKEKEDRELREYVASQTSPRCKEGCPQGYEYVMCGDGLVRRRCLGCNWYYKVVDDSFKLK